MVSDSVNMAHVWPGAGAFLAVGGAGITGEIVETGRVDMVDGLGGTWFVIFSVELASGMVVGLAVGAIGLVSGGVTWAGSGCGLSGGDVASREAGVGLSWDSVVSMGETIVFLQLSVNSGYQGNYVGFNHGSTL